MKPDGGTVRRLVMLALALVLVACGGDSPEPTPPPVEPMPLSATATRAGLASATSTPIVTPMVSQPSATPDPALLGEIFRSAEGEVSFAYPSGWEVNERLLESELLITVESPADVESSGLFVVDLFPLVEPLAPPEIYPLADTFLRNLFAERYDPSAVAYREEGEALIATILDTVGEEQVQYEARFVARSPYLQVLLLVAAAEEWAASAPLLDMMARSVRVNPAVAERLPTPTPETARLGEGLSLVQPTFYGAPTGSLYVVGYVRNDSGQGYEDVRVTVHLLDAAGTRLASQRWPVERFYLGGGEQSPVRLIFNEPPSGWSDYQVEVDARPADFYSDRVTREFEAEQVIGSQPALGSHMVSGRVVNLGPDAREIKVTVTLLDAAGNVLAIESTPLDPPALAGGDSAPFGITFFSQAQGTVAEHEVTIEGLRVPPAP